MLAMFSVRCLAVPVGLLLVQAGCGSSSPALQEVRGTVRFGEAPLTTGVVSLRADQGNTTQHVPTGTIDGSGHYRIYTNSQPGAPPGRYRVVVFATEPTVDTGKASPGMPKSLIPARYNHASTSPLVFEVTASPAAGSYDLRLEKETP